MAALPYIQLYVADYLADTAHLSTEEHGAYILLIFNYWQRGQALNNIKERLGSICKLTPEAWERVKPTLAEFFQIEGDVWFHQRIEADLAAVAEKSRKASDAGKRRQSERSANAQRTLSHKDTEADTDTESFTNPNGLVVRTDGPDASQDEREVSERATDEAQPVKPSRRKAQEPCPTQTIIDLYHRVLPELKGVRVLSSSNAGHVRQLWRTHLKSLDEWERFFGFIRKSDFLMGRTSSAGRDPFVPTLIWLVKPENFANIANRKYHS